MIKSGVIVFNMASNHNGKNSLSMRNLYVLITLSFALFLCTSTAKVFSENQVVHIVLIWLKEPGNEQHITQVIEATLQLKEIEEVNELRIGKSVDSDRDIVDDSFDIGLYMLFDDQEAMQRYLAHPKHKKIVKKSIKPLSKRIRVHDFIP